MIETILKNLGFDTDDIKSYLLLLQTGPVTAGHLAKKLGVPRSSLYGFLKRLNQHGLVSESQNRGVKTFAAESPEKINQLFAERIESLQTSQEQYKKLLPDLRKRQPQAFANPKLQLFEGGEGLQNVLKDMLLYYDIETQAFWPQKKMVEILSSDFFRYHNKERIKNRLSVRAIWPQSQLVSIKDHPYFGAGEKFLREIRIAPAQIDFTLGYWIYGNKVAFISSRQESFGFIIESAEFVKMLLAQFELMWEVSQTLKIDNLDTTLFLKELDR